MIGETNPPARKQTKGERTRARLLAAAELQFAELGYHDASVVRITEAAGVGQGTFYLYFSSKLEVFDEVVEDLNRRVRHAMIERRRRRRTGSRPSGRASLRSSGSPPSTRRCTGSCGRRSSSRRARSGCTTRGSWRATRKASPGRRRPARSATSTRRSPRGR